MDHYFKWFLCAFFRVFLILLYKFLPSKTQMKVFKSSWREKETEECGEIIKMEARPEVESPPKAGQARRRTWTTAVGHGHKDWHLGTSRGWGGIIRASGFCRRTVASHSPRAVTEKGYTLVKRIEFSVRNESKCTKHHMILNIQIICFKLIVTYVWTVIVWIQE